MSNPVVSLTENAFLSAQAGNFEMNAIIEITNLRLRTFIGFNEEERTKQQDIIINAEIHYPMNSGCLDDVVEDALNYKTITKAIIEHVETGRFLLLEKLVVEVLTLCTDYPTVTYAKVKIDKPHALRFADSVSLSLDYHHVKNKEKNQ